MIQNNLLRAILLGGVLLFSTPFVSAQVPDIFSAVLGEVKEETPEAPKDSTVVEEGGYAKLLKDATKAEGFINLYLKKGKLYMEIPLSLLHKPMLYTGRVAQISDNKDVIAGQMPSDPKMVAWSKDDTKVYMHEQSASYSADPKSSIYPRFEDNNIEPILAAYDIKAWAPDSAAVVIDGTSLFLTGDAPMSPFIPSSPFDSMLGAKKLSGSFKRDMSSIRSISSFERNLNVEVRAVYTSSGKPFTAVVNGSLLLLPDEKMRPRLADDRIGYFYNVTLPITTTSMRMEKERYITRWRLEPREQDIAKHRAGGLVVPKQPIVFYYDTAFPKEWWPYIKEGIEDWQQAFEQAGFKQAIIAKPYPDDPSFSPNDARYSCIIYSTSRTPNAMGPSWTDPRTGEILQASVYFYHNVLDLLHNWRFAQTAAADPKARNRNYDIKFLGPMLRYIIAHEVGHTLGLMHNMAASTAYSIADLRSPAFTSKWGTTPSIMDYARYNYIAQPGDGVTNFLPPRLGVYDIYAIKWGYAPIYSAATYRDEVKTLDRWIQEKSNDPRYFYGEQQILNVNDPYALSEDLGDDRVEASRLGIQNLKTTINHLFEWTAERDKDYQLQEALSKAIEQQFRQYLGHVKIYIGGYLRQSPRQGEARQRFVPVPAEKQKEALYFVLDEAQAYPYWMATEEMKKYLGKSERDFDGYVISTMRDLLNISLLSRIGMTSELPTDGTPYTPSQYMQDLFDYVWKEPAELNSALRNLQYTYVSQMISQLELDKADRDSKTSTGKIEGRALIFEYLLKSQELLKSRMGQENGPLTAHYSSLYYLIDRSLQK